MTLRSWLIVLGLFFVSSPITKATQDLTTLIEEGQVFRRTKAQSPIFLQWSRTIQTPWEGKKPGFKVHAFHDKSQLGYITAETNVVRGYIDLSWVSMHSSEHMTEAFRTVLGAFKALKRHLSPEIQYLFHADTPENQPTVEMIKRAGFTESQQFLPSRSQIHLVAEIPTAEQRDPPLINLSSLRASLQEIENFPSEGATPEALFTVGTCYRHTASPGVFLKYVGDIDVEPVLEIPRKDFGFKIFREQEQDEIGFIVPRSLSSGDIRIGAVWINQDVRCKGYCTQAILMVMALYQERSSLLPQARYFSFLTNTSNEAMLRVAQKVNFQENPSPDTNPLALLFGGRVFQRTFVAQSGNTFQ